MYLVTFSNILNQNAMKKKVLMKEVLFFSYQFWQHYPTGSVVMMVDYNKVESASAIKVFINFTNPIRKAENRLIRLSLPLVYDTKLNKVRAN